MGPSIPWPSPLLRQTLGFEVRIHTPPKWPHASFGPCSQLKVTFPLRPPLLKHQGNWPQCWWQRGPASLERITAAFHNNGSCLKDLSRPLPESHGENRGDPDSWSPSCPNLVPQGQKQHMACLCPALASSRAPGPPASMAHSESQTGVLWPTAG